MKAFKFNLQAVLVVREREEQAALEDYARALEVCQQADARLAATERELALAGQDARSRRAGGSPAAQWAQSWSHYQTVTERRNQGALAVNAAERAVSQAWAQVVEARRRREALEKLRARQRADYDRQGQREEQKQLDEMARRPALAAWFNLGNNLQSAT